MTERRESGLPTPNLVPVIHAVTDDRILAHRNFVDRAAAVMGALGARGAVHLRARIVPAAQLYTIARVLAAAQMESECWLVVNDRVDVAAAAGAWAVQLTSRSMCVADARVSAPLLAVGASVHDVDAAREAEREGASWVVAGHVFETASHPDEEGRGLPFVVALRRAVALPVVAIGGVKPEHVRALRLAGVHGVAAISGVWGAADAERAATDYLSAYEQSLQPDRTGR